MTVRLRVAACTLACIAAGAAAAQSLPDGAAECRNRIEQQGVVADDDSEAPRLGELCPEIIDEINAGIWGEAIAEVWAEDLSGNAFIDLTEIVAAYEATRTTSEISPDTLDAALAEAATLVPAPDLSLWERAMQWLQERLGRAPDEDTGWFERWLGRWLDDFSVSERWITIALIVLGIALLMATALIVINELRATGVFGRRSAPDIAAADGGASAAELPRVRTIEDVRRAPLARQPAMLLALVLECLRRKKPIPQSATHRELLTTADLGAEHRVAFAAVVGAAERATFGDWQPATHELTALLAGGESLVRDLSAEDGVPP